MAIEESVSIIGSGYFQPVADLVDRSLRWPATKRSSVRALYYDNIYAVSVILLMVASLESYATRLRYFHGVPAAKRNLTVVEYIKHVFPDFRMAKAATEIFVVRDAIFHNHLWKIDFTWRPLKLSSASLVPHREDRKFRDAVNQATRRTRNLRIHVVPTRIDRRDALKVIDTVWKILIFLEKKDRNFCYVSDHNVPFRGRMRPFREVRDALAAAL
jgi:hypothetical protein